MKDIVKYIYVCAFFLLGTKVSCQTNNINHLDIYNGLPSNHVYSAIKDNYGYLWMCTDNGVVRYNGYDIKVYNFTDGLSNNDVWGLLEDKKGRIWLRSYSNKMGYILNNRYHDAYVAGPPRTLQPLSMGEYDSGIIFTTYRFYNESFRTINASKQLYVERNDTIYPTSFYFETENISCDGRVIAFRQNDAAIYNVRSSRKLEKEQEWPYKYIAPRGNSVSNFVFSNYFISSKQHENELSVFNIDKGTVGKVSVDGIPADNDLSFLNIYKEHLYTIGSRSIYKMDSHLHSIKQFPVGQLVYNSEKIAGSDISFFMDDPFWGRCTATTAYGMFLSQDTNRYYKQLKKPDLGGYRYIGSLSDTVAIFWSDAKRMMMSIDNKNIVHHQPYPNIESAIKILPFNSTTSIFVANREVYLFSNSTYAIWSLPQWVRRSFKTPLRDTLVYQHRFAGMKNVTAPDSNNVYLSYKEFVHIHIKGDSAILDTYAKDRYEGAEVDHYRHAVWAYNSNTVTLHTGDGRSGVGNGHRQYNISNIGKVLTDRYFGNVFFKNSIDLALFDPDSNTLKPLFRDYNLKNTVCRISGDKIIVAGRFGVLFSRIMGRDSFSEPIVYPNFRDNRYFEAKDLAAAGNKVFLQTDKGVYQLAVPADSMFVTGCSFRPQYRVIAQYDRKLYEMAYEQSIEVDQSNTSINFDIVNPYGNGPTQYYYQIEGVDTTWNPMNGHELRLPGLEAGNNYTISVVVADEVWRSRPTNINIYVVPFWWQTTRWAIILALCAILIAAGLITGIVLLTRYYTRKHQQKKQFLTQLELRAIYSQINPHFIFNTLNSALYFIKKKRMDDAYDHVSKFSKLLRAYLDSSRNRYITLQEEITNIRNYVELQQTRFEHLFAYDIIVKDIPSVQHVKIPSLLLQPLIENAINHGLVPKDGPGLLKIEFIGTNDTNDIICIIEDDGVGRQNKAVKIAEGEHRTSYGSDLIKELVSVFNKYDNMKIEISYIDKALPGTGTKVIINIKNTFYAVPKNS